MPKKRELHGDRPLGPRDKDRLGFSAVAERLAKVIVDEASESGFVIGLEGAWGSGKSSLLNLVVANLRSKTESKRPIIVEFQPWVVGERDGLLTALFGELAAAIEASNGAPLKDVVEIGSSAAEKVRAFGARLSGIGRLVSLADDASLGTIPMLGTVGKIVKSIADTSAGLESKRSLADAKGDLSETLRKLSRRILVVIDDLDRLEPKEAVELLRLVRAVADFPNVVYLLCYDHSALARSIEREIGVDSGAAYLEKIVQVAAGVPRPEAFVLRRWFAEELAKFASPGADGAARLVATIEVEGGRRLDTPRSVNRVLDALRFLWPALRDVVDLGDLVWLQLVRHDNPALYKWIEEYCVAMVAINGEAAALPDDSRRHLFEDLEQALKLERQSFSDAWSRLRTYLPGIDPVSNQGAPIANRSEPAENTIASNSRRLASPDHARLYFSLVPSIGAPTDEDFRQLIKFSEQSASAVEQQLRQDLLVKRGPATKTELILDRFGGPISDQVSSAVARNLLTAVSNLMDDAARISGVGEWGRYWIWVTADVLLPKLMRNVPQTDRSTMLSETFGQGKALGWLSTVWRSELRAHGKLGKDNSPPLPMLDSAELELVQDLMVQRIKAVPQAVVEVPNLLQLLFTWGLSTTMDNPRQFLLPLTQSDDGLVLVLEGMSSWRTVNGHVQFPITRENISPFIDYDAAQRRLETIVAMAEQQSPIRKRALVLVGKFKLGQDD